MDIILLTNSENPRLEFRNCEKFADDSGYKVDVFVRSGGFTWETTFYFECFPLKQFTENLSKMEATLSGNALLKPMWEDDYIEFEMLGLGHVSVKGEFSQYSDYEQKFKFGFETDQTALAPFCEELKQLASID